MPAAYLATLAADLLDAAGDGLTLVRTGHAPPERVYVSHGRPAVDGCEQLTVHADERRAVWHRSMPDRPNVPQTCLLAPVAVLVVQLWRCVPVAAEDGTPPTAAELDTAADDLLIDAWCLLTQLYGEHKDGTLFTGVTCRNVTFGDLLALPPQGGMAGWELRVEVGLDDAGP